MAGVGDDDGRAWRGGDRARVRRVAPVRGCAAGVRVGAVGGGRHGERAAYASVLRGYGAWWEHRCSSRACVAEELRRRQSVV